MLVPLVFVIVLTIQTGGPNDIPLGRYIRETGLATPFVVLFFMSIWAFPLITALVAGDIVAAESHNGTLKTILTRSRNRGEIYAAKVLATFTYTVVVDLRDGCGRRDRRQHRVGVQRPDVALGHRPSLRGMRSDCSPRASRSTRGRWPAIAAFGLLLSTVTRNSAAAVVGTLMWALLMQLLGVLPGTESIRPYLLGTQFQAWHGFLRTPADWVPVVRALWVCAFYVVIPLAAGYLVFLRRDVAGD